MADSRRLQQLVDEQRYDELLREVTLDDIAGAWIHYQRRAPQGRPSVNDPDWWAVELWMDDVPWSVAAWWRDEMRVRAGILAIIGSAEPRDDDIIGAAIMEVFVTNDDDRVGWLEEQARDSERFRGALGNVWLGRELSEATADRVERAAGVPLVRLGPPGRRRA